MHGYRLDQLKLNKKNDLQRKHSFKCRIIFAQFVNMRYKPNYSTLLPINNQTMIYLLLYIQIITVIY